MNSSVKYGQEHGRNLIKICKKLFKNENLCRLLVNTDLDPLNKDKHPEQINGMELFQKNIRVVPLLRDDEQTTESKIILFYDSGDINSSNSDNENLSFVINVYCPFKEWRITGDDLRPYAIMSEIRKSLQDTRINGLGEIRYEGFELSTLTEEMSAHTMRFYINAFS